MRLDLSGLLRPFTRLSRRDRRALLLGVLVSAPPLLYVGVVRPYRAALAQVRERTAAELALLERERALLAAAPTFPARIEATRKEVKRAELRLLQAANPALAEAELTDQLAALATRSRVLLEEMRALEAVRSAALGDEEEPISLTPVRLRVRGESDLEGVLTFLHRIETGRYLLRVAQLSIEPEVARPSRNNRDRDEESEPRLTGVVQFTLLLEAFTGSDAPSFPMGLEGMETRFEEDWR